jgi:hypothetical protein
MYVKKNADYFVQSIFEQGNFFVGVLYKFNATLKKKEEPKSSYFVDLHIKERLQKIYNCLIDLKNQHTSPKVFILFSFFFFFVYCFCI